MKKVAFYTLGCKLNFSETSTIARQFEQKGFKKVGFDQSPDIFVINTCSVTENADKKCKAIVKQALKESPNALIAVTGCYAQLKPKKIAEIPGVDIVLGAAEKFRIPEKLNGLPARYKPSHWQAGNSRSSLRDLRGKKVFPEYPGDGRGAAKVYASEIDHVNQFTPSYSIGDRTRSFLKVQDGCNYGCSFCTIPLARGKSRSDSIENVVSSANKIAESGVKEIILSGINIGDFKPPSTSRNAGPMSTGHQPPQRGENWPSSKFPTKGKRDGKVPPLGGDLGGAGFYELVQELDKVEGIERFRISSIEPNLLTDEIIDFVANSKRFMPHFHIPLQSGCNKILKLMRRRYLKELYAERVEKIKKVMPDCCIGADVIAGFPRETEEDFLETYNFINQLNVSYLHVFTYSERDNTNAIKIPHSVPMKERNKRGKMLRILSEKKRRYFYEQHLGKVANVLFEREAENDFMRGFTENYIRVSAPYASSRVNKIITVKLKGIDKNVFTCSSIRVFKRANINT